MRFIPALYLCCLLLLSGCSATAPQKVQSFTPIDGQSLLTVYLTTSGSALAAVAFTIDQVELYSGESWLGLAMSPVRVDRDSSRGQQLLLGLGSAPAGDYRRIRLRISALTINGQQVANPGDAEVVEIVLSERLPLENRGSSCLFVDWNLSGRQAGVLPIFSAYGQGNPLAAGLVYVVCDDIDTVYVVRADSNEVVSSFAVPGPLGEIRVDQQARKLYILSAGQRSLYVYDCVKSRFLEKIVLPGTIAPKHLALFPQAKLAYVTDAVSGQILKVDLAAGVVAVQQRLSHKPKNLTFFTRGDNRLAVLAPSAQKVYMLNSDSLRVLNNFSVGMDSSSLRLFDNSLFVAEQAANMVASYDYQTGRLRDRVPVGLLPSDLLSIGDRQLWVSNRGSSTISVLVAGQKTAFRRIKVPAAPSALQLFPSRNLVYVASYQEKNLAVIEVTGGRVRKNVALAGSPLAIEVLD